MSSKMADGNREGGIDDSLTFLIWESGLIVVP